MIAHIVLFRPKASITAEQRRSFALKIAEAGWVIPSIKRGFVGRSVEIDPGYSRSLGESTYQYAAVLEFESRQGLVEYLNHPLHEEIGRLMGRSTSFSKSQLSRAYRELRRILQPDESDRESEPCLGVLKTV